MPFVDSLPRDVDENEDEDEYTSTGLCLNALTSCSCSCSTSHFWRPGSHSFAAELGHGIEMSTNNA